MKPQQLKIADITLDERLQMRVEMSQETIDDYADHFDKLPPPKITLDEEGRYLLTDGWHTVKAALKLEKTEIACIVETGTWVTALFAAAGANHGHGMRRTNADKHKAVETLLKISEEEGHFWTQTAIAMNCHVTQQFVSKLVNKGKSTTVVESPPVEDQLPVGNSAGAPSTNGAPPKEIDLRCDACKRKGVKDQRQLEKCVACAEKRRQYLAKKGKGGKAGGGKKQGAEAFTLAAMNEHLSRAQAELDKLATEYGSVNGRGEPVGPEHAGLLRKIAEVRDDADKWHKQLKKQGRVK